MLRDSFWNRQFIGTASGESGVSLPQLVRRDVPVAFDPIESALASYITRQVADILVEIQETPLRPFVEGEPIGTVALAAVPNPVLGVPQADFNRMSARMWAAHNGLPAAARHRSYTTDRMAPNFRKYRFTWVPANESFHIEKLS